MGLFEICKSFGKKTSKTLESVSSVLDDFEKNTKEFNNKLDLRIALDEIFKGWTSNFRHEKLAWRTYVSWASIYSTKRSLEKEGSLEEFQKSMKGLLTQEFLKDNSELLDSPQKQIKNLFFVDQYSLCKCSQLVALNCPVVDLSKVRVENRAEITAAVKRRYAQLMSDREREFALIKQEIVKNLNEQEIIPEALDILKSKFICEGKIYLWNEMKIDHLVDDENVRKFISKYKSSQIF